MVIGLLGRKVGMTQVYDLTGDVVPVTVIQAGPCKVLQVKTVDRDGYEAVQLGYLDKPRRLASRSQRGHVAKLDSKRQKARTAAGISAIPKADCEPQRLVREFRTPVEGIGVGTELGVDAFQPVLEELPDMLKQLAEQHKIQTDKPNWKEKLQKDHVIEFRDVVHSIMAVDIVGTSKGRGTAGAMKRHNFRGQRASHGVKKCHRHVGGTGCSASPSRLFKGKKMAGRYGGVRSTVRNLKVFRIDLENNLLLVRGAVPGPNGGYLIIRESNKLPGRLPNKEEA